MDLRTASDRLGVHYQTAYRWVRDGSLPAVKIRSTYEVTEDDVEAFLRRRRAPAPPPKQTKVRSWDLQVGRLHAFLFLGDELGARQAVDRLAEGGVDPLQLCENLFAPTMRRIGQDWAEGRLTVADEHRASAIAERLLARIATHPRGRPRGVAVVATVPGEEHGLSATMGAIVLRADRWRVHHLGTQVPVDDLLTMARREAQLVVLSYTNDSSRQPTADVAALLRAASLRVLIGSPGASLNQLVAEARTARA